MVGASDRARALGLGDVVNILLLEEFRLRAQEAKECIERGIESGAGRETEVAFSLPSPPRKRRENVL